MKKLISAMLILGLSMSLWGWKQHPQQTEITESTESRMYLYTHYQVAQPLSYPDYTFDHTPTTEELRQMAVDAMADMLGVQWCVDRFFSYSKSC